MMHISNTLHNILTLQLSCGEHTSHLLIIFSSHVYDNYASQMSWIFLKKVQTITFYLLLIMACAYYTSIINVNNNNAAATVSKHNKGIAVTKMTASNDILHIRLWWVSMQPASPLRRIKCFCMQTIDQLLYHCGHHIIDTIKI